MRDAEGLGDKKKRRTGSCADGGDPEADRGEHDKGVQGGEEDGTNSWRTQNTARKDGQAAAGDEPATECDDQDDQEQKPLRSLR